MIPIEEEKTIHLSEYYRLMLRNKWIIVVSLAIAIFLTIRYNARLVPIYRATAILIIDHEIPISPITGSRDYYYYTSYLSETLTFKTHFQLITSLPVLEQVVKNLKLDMKNEKQPETEIIQVNPVKQFFSHVKSNFLLLMGRQQHSPPPPDPHTSLIMALKSMVSIENVEETRLLKINASSPSPERAMDVANGIAEAYINFNINNRMKSSQDMLSWLTDRLYETKKRLEDAEEEFLTYKQNLKLISVEDRRKMIAQKIADFNTAYLEARNNRLELDVELDQIKKLSQSDKNISLPRSLIENSLINQLHAQLVNAELELSRLAKVYKSKHPKMIQTQSHIVQTRERLNQEIQKELDNLNAKRAVLASREKVLQQTIVDFEKEGMETNKKELESTILQRNVEMNRNMYDALLSKLKEADIAENINISNIRIVEKAQLPTNPISPNKKRNLLLAAVMGIIIGFVIGFVWEYHDRSLRTEEDVQKYLNLPVLSVIPSADKGSQVAYVRSPDPPDIKTKA